MCRLVQDIQSEGNRPNLHYLSAVHTTIRILKKYTHIFC